MAVPPTEQRSFKEYHVNRLVVDINLLFIDVKIVSHKAFVLNRKIYLNLNMWHISSQSYLLFDLFIGQLVGSEAVILCVKSISYLHEGTCLIMESFNQMTVITT